MSEHSYVEERDGRHYLRGQRVPVTALAVLWREGASPETMVENYPTLTLAHVYGGLAFYLEHRFVIDQHLLDDQATFDAGHAAQRAADPERYADLERRCATFRAQEPSNAS